MHMKYTGRASHTLGIFKESYKGSCLAMGLLHYSVIKAFGLACYVDFLNADAGLIWMPC